MNMLTIICTCLLSKVTIKEGKFYITKTVLFDCHYETTYILIKIQDFSHFFHLGNIIVCHFMLTFFPPVNSSRYFNKFVSLFIKCSSHLVKLSEHTNTFASDKCETVLTQRDTI